MNLAIDRTDLADLDVRAALAQLDRENRAFWLAIPEDVMAGIYEEVVWTKQMALPLH